MADNIYGDTLTAGIDDHGVDIAVQRVDDLDKKILEYIATKSSPRVLDLGSGSGGQSLRMVESGAHVTAVDIHDFSELFSELRTKNELPIDDLQFICGDLTRLPEFLPGQTFELCLSQRTFHYLRYQRALNVLTFLHKIVTERIYISVSGLNTELGNGYPSREISVENRWGKLSLDMAKKHHIDAPVCLYTKQEFSELLKKSGWTEVECWESPFGNIKAVFSH